MPGLVPGIHALAAKQDVDGRDKPGHDSCVSWITGSRAPWRVEDARKRAYGALKTRVNAPMARARNDGESYAPPPLARNGAGSTGVEPFRISKCTCGAVTLPVWPALAMIWPRFTVSSRLTMISLACA